MLFKLQLKPEAALKEVPLSSLDQAGFKEKDLEDILAKRLELVLQEDQLLVVSQERKWQEEADILALDESGTLYIFEIKRWQGDKSNLLQVIRYGQIFGQYDYGAIEECFRRNVQDQSASLQKRHQTHFELQAPLEYRRFNADQKFVLVTAGSDVQTLQAVRYWRSKGLPIEIKTYHVFKDDDRFYVAFDSFAPDVEDYTRLASKSWMVNTCETYRPGAYRAMLAEKKAAAFTDRKNAVNPIQPNDKVFLYHTGIGVIAGGRAMSTFQIAKCDGETDGEHFVPLDLDFHRDPASEPGMCVSAWEINQACKTSHRFRQTAFQISDDMAKKISSLVAAKQSKGS